MALSFIIDDDSMRTDMLDIGQRASNGNTNRFITKNEMNDVKRPETVNESEIIIQKHQQ